MEAAFSFWSLETWHFPRDPCQGLKGWISSQEEIGHIFERLIYAYVQASLPHLLWNCNTATEKSGETLGFFASWFGPSCYIFGWSRLDGCVLGAASNHTQWWQILLKVLTFICFLGLTQISATASLKSERVTTDTTAFPWFPCYRGIAPYRV